MTKTIDVTLASMRNAGDLPVSPKGVIRAAITRAANDEDIREVEALYNRQPGQPMHPSGATGISPGKSLTFNVTKRLTVKGDEDGDGHPDEMLVFSRDLEESELEKYQGSFNRKVLFDEIDGFTTVSCDYNVINGGITKQIIATYTVNLISG
jgi:hypothetical protein